MKLWVAIKMNAQRLDFILLLIVNVRNFECGSSHLQEKISANIPTDIFYSIHSNFLLTAYNDISKTITSRLTIYEKWCVWHRYGIYFSSEYHCFRIKNCKLFTHYVKNEHILHDARMQLKSDRLNIYGQIKSLFYKYDKWYIFSMDSLNCNIFYRRWLNQSNTCCVFNNVPSIF